MEAVGLSDAEEQAGEGVQGRDVGFVAEADLAAKLLVTSQRNNSI